MFEAAKLRYFCVFQNGNKGAVCVKFVINYGSGLCNVPAMLVHL